MKPVYLVMQLSKSAGDNMDYSVSKYLFVRQHDGQGSVHTKYNNGWTGRSFSDYIYTGFQLEFLS